MKQLSEYNINFASLKQGIHLFEYEIDNTFFQLFECDEFTSADFNVKLTFEKQSTMLLLNFKIKGTIEVPCDRCLDEVKLKIKGEENLIVKFGDEDYDDTDDLVVLSENEHQINIAKYIYEYIQINVPQKRAHKKKECNQEMIAKLKKIEVKENKIENIDPRWSKLTQLKTEN
ncbi:MAG: DUF177 domain-containing protein [Vicingaceae bacterium]|nr:DUF177 domain-containing protein [Vicingaceae bacterium]